MQIISMVSLLIQSIQKVIKHFTILCSFITIIWECNHVSDDTQLISPSASHPGLVGRDLLLPFPSEKIVDSTLRV